MELSLASPIILVSPLLTTFDSIFYSGRAVEGTVYDAECTRTQNGHNGECTIINGLSQRLGCRRRVRHSGCGWCWKQLSPVTVWVSYVVVDRKMIRYKDNMVKLKLSRLIS